VWGNGESAIKLARAILVFLGVMTLIDVVKFKVPLELGSWYQSVLEMPQVFLGTFVPPYYTGGYLAVITFGRLVALAFLMSIVIKRFNRR